MSLRIESDPWVYGRYQVLNTDNEEVGSYILCHGYFSSAIGYGLSRPGPSGSVLADSDVRREGVYDKKKLDKLQAELMRRC